MNKFKDIVHKLPATSMTLALLVTVPLLAYLELPLFGILHKDLLLSYILYGIISMVGIGLLTAFSILVVTIYKELKSTL